MQDSMEDYLSLLRNIPGHVSDKISKEMVVTAQLKKECDARAMKIVEFSIEGKLRPEVFTKCLPFINQSHYQDIVEERAITKLCGYSICGKRIPEMPKKQYFISTKSNKVYDITERKNFCSNFCYKASLHVKKQMDNNPLWLRKLEDIPEYTLLHSSEGGLPGEYIDQGIVKPAQEVNFTSIGLFAGASLGDICDREGDRTKNKKTKYFHKPSRLKSTMQTINETEIEEESQILSSNSRNTKINEEKRSQKIKKDNLHKLGCVVSLPSIEENEEKILERLQGTKDFEADTKLEIKENIQKNNQDTKKQIEVKSECSQSKIHSNCDNLDAKIPEITIKSEPPEKVSIDTEKSNSKKLKKSVKKKTGFVKPKTVDIEDIIKTALEEWLTIETCIFIHGEPEVRRVLNEKKLSDYFDELHISELRIEQQKKYMEICRRLHLQEMADEKFDSAVTGNQKLRPLPDYRKLKEDTKDMTLKVKSFFEGTLYEQLDTNFPAKKNETVRDAEEGPPAVLPPVDVNSQKLLRRKIFLNSLNKAIQQLLQSLGVSYFSAVLSDVQGLVKTFNLKANNITFKPIVWNYIALVLLDLLSLKEESVKEILEERRSQEYIKVLFDSLPNKRNFVNDVLMNVKQIELFVERYITKNDGDNV